MLENSQKIQIQFTEEQFVNKTNLVLTWVKIFVIGDRAAYFKADLVHSSSVHIDLIFDN